MGIVVIHTLQTTEQGLMKITDCQGHCVNFKMCFCINENQPQLRNKWNWALLFSVQVICLRLYEMSSYSIIFYPLDYHSAISSCIRFNQNVSYVKSWDQKSRKSLKHKWASFPSENISYLHFCAQVTALIGPDMGKSLSVEQDKSYTAIIAKSIKIVPCKNLNTVEKKK